MRAQSLRLDLGCGRYKKSGYIGVDKFAAVSPDIVCDIEREQLPYPDGSVDEIYSSQVFEHLRDLNAVMEECHRVLRPQGLLHVTVPYWSSEGAFRDPTHVRFFSEKSFDYWEAGNECAYYASVSPYKIESVDYLLHPSVFVHWARRLFGIRFLKAFNNMIVSVEFKLRAVK
ncbi:class I SAM-dependent methyltransferase [Aquabacterium sp. NJ1]|uniref:class I SAM-dependent methyltransferase n=1 Tax=Aquabacterium sp. NJ1 TaxID=1538295 RepID=UPI001377C909|nr:class I SAM-dependent methyltransferase [Aquabacterium sp. NJ1]